MAQPIILDCDPGHDDAIAPVVLLPELDVLSPPPLETRRRIKPAKRVAHVDAAETHRYSCRRWRR